MSTEPDAVQAESSDEEEVATAAPTEKSSEPDYKDLYQRLLAEQENARKRLQAERDQVRSFAMLTAVSDLLPVLDNFYRATDHVPTEQKDSAWLTGILHIQRQLTDVLLQWGVEEIKVQEGDRFDPNLHEAVSTEQKEGMAEDTIITIQRRGYTLKGRVVRPVQVVVSQVSESK